jgi:hypothetical protein
MCITPTRTSTDLASQAARQVAITDILCQSLLEIQHDSRGQFVLEVTLGQFARSWIVSHFNNVDRVPAARIRFC